MKRNIFSRTYDSVVVPLAKAADPLSWVFFVIFLASVAAHLILYFNFVELPGDETFYERNSWWMMYLAWGLLVCSTINPLIYISEQRKEAPLALLIAVAVVHLTAYFCISGVVLVQKYPNNPATLTALLAAAAGAVMVGVGWVVQFYGSSRVQKRAHTFNVLMQSRLSSEFQEQLRCKDKHFPTNGPLEKADLVFVDRESYSKHIANLQVASDQERVAYPDRAAEIDKKLEDELAACAEKVEAIKGVMYILNFYEFLCAGIESGDLDEAFLHRMLRGIAVNLHRDTEELRKFAKNKQPKAFADFDEVVGKRWITGSPAR